MSAETSFDAVSRRFLPVLLLLFVGSGCSALVYQIVWFQLLQLVIGSSAISLGVLLGTFMGGMCLGSFGFARLVSIRRHPLAVYAILELGIGVTGLALLFLLPLAGDAYLVFARGGTPAVAWRAVVCAAALLPPTILMGATLPAIARWMEATPKGVSLLGFFYGANIAGAVFGCLLAGFYLLRVYDVAVATYVAVAINLAVAAVGLGLAAFAPYQPQVQQPESGEAAVPRARWPVYVAIGLSGMAALGAEVVWTRLLSLMLGATVYTFSIILAVFLIGLGIGSSIGSLLARSRMCPRLALGLCQLLLTAAVAWAASLLCLSLPYWPIDVSLAASPWTMFQLDLMRCVWTMLPAACLWGASFPLALAAAASRGQDPGRLVGGVYAANTVGAIAGALVFSMMMIPAFGTQIAQRSLMGLSVAAALLVLTPRIVRLRRTAQPTEPTSPPGGLFGSLGLLGMFGVAVVLIASVPKPPPGLIAYGRYLPTYPEMPEFLHVGEGMNASIAISELPSGVRSFHVSGKVVASSEPQDMRLQRLLGHLPALVHPRPESVLVVGCGAAVTAGCFVLHPDVQRIVICEIEPSIPSAAGRYFGPENHHVISDPRVELVYDDARHYIVTTGEQFDIITSDPIHPWVKGAASLYSKEYFERCKQHLKPGGIVTQWVPLYETNLASVQSQIATFLEVFPGGTIWSNDIAGEGYDIILLAQAEPMRIDVGQLQRRLERPDHLEIFEALNEIHLGSALGLMKTYAGGLPELQPWLAGAQINRDRSLRLQYLAGMGLNAYEAGAIFDGMVALRRYPEDLFIVSGLSELALRVVLDGPPKKD